MANARELARLPDHRIEVPGASFYTQRRAESRRRARAWNRGGADERGRTAADRTTWRMFCKGWCLVLVLLAASAQAVTLTPPTTTTAGDPLASLEGCIIGAVEIASAGAAGGSGVSGTLQTFTSPAPGVPIHAGLTCPVTGTWLRWVGQCWNAAGHSENGTLDVDCISPAPVVPTMSAE